MHTLRGCLKISFGTFNSIARPLKPEHSTRQLFALIKKLIASVVVATVAYLALMWWPRAALAGRAARCAVPLNAAAHAAAAVAAAVAATFVATLCLRLRLRVEATTSYSLNSSAPCGPFDYKNNNIDAMRCVALRCLLMMSLLLLLLCCLLIRVNGFLNERAISFQQWQWRSQCHNTPNTRMLLCLLFLLLLLLLLWLLLSD